MCIRDRPNVMKNFLLLILLFAINSSYAQSKHTFNLVASYGQSELNSPEHDSWQLTTNGQSFTIGFEINKFLNQKKEFSISYGILNQLNQFSNQIHEQTLLSGNNYATTHKNKFQSFDILLPVKIQGHLGKWSLYTGIIPTYHFSTKLSRKSTFEPTFINGETIETTANIDVCNPLFQRCFFNNKFPFLKYLEFQYTAGIQYQINRFSLFFEFSNYLWERSINPYGSIAPNIDIDFFNPDFGSRRRSISVGTSFRFLSNE